MLHALARMMCFHAFSVAVTVLSLIFSVVEILSLYRSLNSEEIETLDSNIGDETKAKQSGLVSVLVARKIYQCLFLMLNMSLFMLITQHGKPVRCVESMFEKCQPKLNTICIKCCLKEEQQTA